MRPVGKFSDFYGKIVSTLRVFEQISMHMLTAYKLCSIHTLLRSSLRSGASRTDNKPNFRSN